MAAGADNEELTRRERRKREVRDRIVTAAVQRFVRQGFGETTVDQIAEDADVAQKTFFNYFPTKQALLEALAIERIEELHEILEDQRARPGATREKLEHCFRRLAERVERQKRLAQDLVIEIMRASPPGSGSAELSKMHDSFGALLRDGQVAGDVRRDRSVEFLTEMVVGVFNAVMINWVSIPGYAVKERLAETAAFVGEAISPPPAGRRQRSGP
jgi:AcrR family transcriptional regulator